MKLKKIFMKRIEELEELLRISEAKVLMVQTENQQILEDSRTLAGKFTTLESLHKALEDSQKVCFT